MKYRLVADAYARIEATDSRLEMTALLGALFRATPREVIARVVYLTQGKLRPDFEGVEIGVAEKLAVRALAEATGAPEAEVARRLSAAGDLGTVAEALCEAGRREATLTVEDVHGALERAAHAVGKGAQGSRLEIVASLLRRATPLEARYLVRTVTGKLRLGVGDMTALDALASTLGGEREQRLALERAYNRTSDLGLVAETMAREGFAGVRRLRVVVGKPIRSMLAERLPDPGEILRKLGGRCAAEYKYDGERIQIHKRGAGVELFSRRLERVTHQYPDVVEAARRHVEARETIVEGEVVAIDAASGELRPFQDLMQRRRKYGIEEAREAVPTAFFAFDALYLDGRDLTDEPFAARRSDLARIVSPGERFGLVVAQEVASVGALEDAFARAIQDGCEGLVCKSLQGVYQAGARGWLWIKLKREYRHEMAEPVDLVVVGAFRGRGRRGGSYGALLMAAYDPRQDLFPTACKLGTGFSDRDLADLRERLAPLVRPHRPPRVQSELVPDLWIDPALVLEVVGAEFTVSPVHCAARNLFREGSGLAIRFPRFTGRHRSDKGPEDATTVDEIAEMYRRARRRV
jgi:DNA ligase-1